MNLFRDNRKRLSEEEIRQELGIQNFILIKV